MSLPSMNATTLRARPARPRRPSRGFTLVELLLVLVILGILASLVLPKFTGRTEQARVTAAQTQISTFGTASSARLSSFFTRARSELPCAATSRVIPAASSGSTTSAK